MEDKHDVLTYMKLADAAEFYLYEAFQNIITALEHELASIFFTKKLEIINAIPEDDEAFRKSNLPNDNISLLRGDYGDVLSNQTQEMISLAMREAEIEAKEASHCFMKTHSVNSTCVLGHINNLAFFIETLTNRHLLFLKHSGVMDSFTYNQLAQGKILIRLIFVFRHEIDEGKIQLNEITNLFSLRNKTVHYTPDNAISLQVNLETLIKIWEQIVKLIKVFELRENFDEYKFSQKTNEQIQYFKIRWLNIANI